MHYRFAIWTEPGQCAKPADDRDKICHPTGRGLRHSAPEAIELAGLQRRLPSLQAIFEKGSDRCAAHDSRPAIVRDREATLDPHSNGVLVHAERVCGFLNGVRKVRLNAPRIDPTIGHAYGAAITSAASTKRSSTIQGVQRASGIPNLVFNAVARGAGVDEFPHGDRTRLRSVQIGQQCSSLRSNCRSIRSDRDDVAAYDERHQTDCVEGR
jgi:hypothetical protein